MFPFVGYLVIAILVGVLAVAGTWFLGSSNPSTPAGYVGYVTQGSVFGKRQFLGTQAGPTSTGRTWLADVVNVSITPYTFDEEFAGESAILSKDSLKIAFAVHLVWRVDPAQVKPFVEQFSTLQGSDETADKIVRAAYDNYLKQPLRTYARDELQRFNGLEIKDHIAEIGAVVEQRVQALCAGTPFDVKGVVVGNIQYPTEVSDAVSEKLAATQILERKRTEITIAEADAKRRVVEAQGIADSMAIINLKLTNQYLQHEAIEAQKTMVGSPNHTMIYIPVGPMGVPLTAAMDADGANDTPPQPKAE
jgi:regulator of protease activity HflC (stomatin/prohibitin superfamily)